MSTWITALFFAPGLLVKADASCLIYYKTPPRSLTASFQPLSNFLSTRPSIITTPQLTPQCLARLPPRTTCPRGGPRGLACPPTSRSRLKSSQLPPSVQPPSVATRQAPHRSEQFCESASALSNKTARTKVTVGPRQRALSRLSHRTVNPSWSKREFAYPGLH